MRQRLATYGQRNKQYEGAERKLAEDDLAGAEAAQGELDEQEPGPPQHREDAEAKQTGSSDSGVLGRGRSSQTTTDRLELFVEVDNLASFRMLAHQRGV
jgi:hypothetical protein